MMDMISREGARNAVVQSGSAMDAVAAINALPAVPSASVSPDVAALVEAVKRVKAHADNMPRLADFHATCCQCWRCTEDEMFAALAALTA